MQETEELFVLIGNVWGTLFIEDRRRKRSLMNPLFLKRFKEDYPPTEEEYEANQREVAKLIREVGFPTLPDHLKWYFYKGVLKEVNGGLVFCYDGKFRKCKAVKFNFKYEGNLYSDIFYIDKSLKEHCAILGSSFWSKFDMKE